MCQITLWKTRPCCCYTRSCISATSTLDSIQPWNNGLHLGKTIVIYSTFCSVCGAINFCTEISADGTPTLDLELPTQWLWDIVDEFIYQFQSFCQYRSKLKSLKVEELNTLKNNPQVRSCWSTVTHHSRCGMLSVSYTSCSSLWASRTPSNLWKKSKRELKSLCTFKIFLNILETGLNLPSRITLCIACLDSSV